MRSVSHNKADQCQTCGEPCRLCYLNWNTGFLEPLFNVDLTNLVQQSHKHKITTHLWQSPCVCPSLSGQLKVKMTDGYCLFSGWCQFNNFLPSWLPISTTLNMVNIHHTHSMLALKQIHKRSWLSTMASPNTTAWQVLILPHIPSR